MVCEDCHKKSKALAVPDKWKDGAKSVSSTSGGAIKSLRTNKALDKKKIADQWIPQDRLCRICKSKVQAHMNYCNDCAYKRGICAGCGKKAVDVSSYKMSVV